MAWKKRKNVFHKCVLNLNLTLISDIVFSSFLEKKDNVTAPYSIGWYFCDILTRIISAENANFCSLGILIKSVGIQHEP